jgi:hypothetical protein
MFRTAEAAGWTPEARYKTSLYNMMAGLGQSVSEAGFGVFPPRVVGEEDQE